MAGHNTAAPSAHDWHPADVKAALEKAGWSLRSLASSHDLHHATLAQALHSSYPAAERRIAAALSMHPMAIWPSRYHADGKPNGQPGNPNWIARAATQKKRSTSARARHVKSARAG